MHGRVVLGMSSTVDSEVVWDDATVQDLVERLGIGLADLERPGPPTDLAGMVAVLLRHLGEGSGAEHYVAAPELLYELLGEFSSRRTLGGTGVRAGIALAAIGVPSTAVMAAADPDVHRLLPALCRAVPAAEVDRLVPHLILQYPAGATVRVGRLAVVAPAPNRVIFAHDEPNERLEVPPSFDSLVSRASVVLVSSLNAIRDTRVLDARLRRITTALSKASDGAVRIWEDAGYHVPQLGLAVVRAMAAHVDLVSMNEDEMQAYLGRSVDLLDPADVATAAGSVRRLVGARTLLVHTRWWSLVQGEDVERYRPALRGGIAMASARYAYGDALTPERYAQAATWPRDARSVELARSLDRGDVACEPGVVPPALVPTTIGLGDTFIGGVVGTLAQGPVAASWVGGLPDRA